MIIKEHRDRIDQPIERQDKLSIEHESYKNPPVNSNLSTTIHERGQGRISEPNRFKIEISTIENEAPPKVSLASISCPNKIEMKEDVYQIKIVTPKDQIQQQLAKYISPHLRKVDKV